MVHLARRTRYLSYGPQSSRKADDKAIKKITQSRRVKWQISLKANELGFAPACNRERNHKGRGRINSGGGHTDKRIAQQTRKLNTQERKLEGPEVVREGEIIIDQCRPSVG
ncbi:hypothetical protein PoB_006083100 [Plakobranchus ocellatus]|uniref:Uncharacterized protein n=1 Tax=Plakobranchus ocellatus TaxID=259542 RepID=A0AAV4CR51_9GAST|nr:hypothetical protein PoB_006083100 [Plakobranchus ocellatus]